MWSPIDWLSADRNINTSPIGKQLKTNTSLMELYSPIIMPIYHLLTHYHLFLSRFFLLFWLNARRYLVFYQRISRDTWLGGMRLLSLFLFLFYYILSSLLFLSHSLYILFLSLPSVHRTSFLSHFIQDSNFCSGSILFALILLSVSRSFGPSFLFPLCSLTPSLLFCL